MKTKITTLLIASFFFLSVSAYADDAFSKPSTDPSNIYIGPPEGNNSTYRGKVSNNFSILDYVLPRELYTYLTGYFSIF